MTPAVPLARPTASGQATPEPDFWRRLEALKAEHAALWWQTASDTPVLGDPVSRRRQRGNARATAALIDELAAEVESCPEAEPERALWRRRLRERVQRFGEERFGWPAGYRELLFADDFYACTVAFAREARRFDPGLDLGDLFQALRNVWIVNSLQMLLGLPVELTPATFAYSMLYPLTDNTLDDPAVPGAAKRELNDRLGRRLAGDPVAPLDRRQEDVFRLVERIEGQYPRAAFPEVYLSLQAIHRGQVRSLGQQGRRRSPSEVDLVAISVEKGGSSVLADGYLAAGTLGPDEAEFCFGYGVFLQLLDDLQDARSDRRAEHMTLFSETAGVWPLDRLTSRLYHYMCHLLERSPRFAAPRYAAAKDLIRRNCTFLLVGAVAENRELFSRRFRRALAARWPLGLAALRRLRRRAQQRYEQTAQALERRGAQLDSALIDG